MKNIFFIAAAAIAATFALSSCVIEKRNVTDSSATDGSIVSSYKINEFDKLDISGACTLIYTQGSSDSLRLEGDSKSLERIEVSQDGSTLSIKRKQSISIFGINNTQNDDVRVYLSSAKFSNVDINIDISGACDIYMDEPVNFGNLFVTSSGASSLNIKDITADNLKIRSSGASDIDIDKATLKSFHARMSGAGDIDAKLNNTDKVDLQVSGAGDADLKLTDCGDVKVSISGAGSITVSGNARSLSQSKSGMASIDTDDLSISK